MIFYFSGTGNTKWAAEQLASATHDSLYYIPDELKKGTLEYTLQEGERLGICFPTHGWQVPRIVRQFIRKATFTSPLGKATGRRISGNGIEREFYIYALTTCGDNMGHAMRILNKELGQKGLHTDAAFAIVMPESKGRQTAHGTHLPSGDREAAGRRGTGEGCHSLYLYLRDRRLLQQTLDYGRTLLGGRRGLHRMRTVQETVSSG